MGKNSGNGNGVCRYVRALNSKSSVLDMNPRDSIAILIEISWGIFWPSLHLPNLCNSLLHQTITSGYFIRSLINLSLNVCFCELSCAAPAQRANVNKSLKLVSLLAKIVFMSKVLGSRCNDLQRFGRYQEGQKISHKISIKLPHSPTPQTLY